MATQAAIGASILHSLIGKRRKRNAKPQWPTIAELAACLRQLNDRYAHEQRTALGSGDESGPDCDGTQACDDPSCPNAHGIEVRLQVSAAGWQVWDGDPCYDTDHRGYWGSTTLDGRRMNSRQVARELIDEARDQHACCSEEP